MEKIKDVRIMNVRFAGDDLAKIDAIAKRSKVSTAFVLRYIVHQFVQSQKDIRIIE